MEAREYDVIIIGAGHNSLTTAMYLADAGLSVLLMERRHEFGGGLSTEEVTLPGFYHNLHSNFHIGIPFMPPYADFNLMNRGVVYYHPEANIGMPLRDGRSLIISTNNTKTHKSMSAFSKNDADKWADFFNRSLMFYVEGLAMAYSPPPDSPEVWEILREEQANILGWEPGIENKSAYECILKDYENPHIQALLMFHMAIGGVDIRKKGTAETGMGFLARINNWQLCQGGSHQLGHAMGAVFLEKGGDLIENAHVTRILVEGGKAAGVETKDGRRFKARQAVVSGIDPHQTILEFLTEDEVETNLRKKVEGIIYGHGDVLFGVHLALNEPPKYKCAGYDPDMQNVLNLNIGYETPEDLVEHYEEIDRRELPAVPRLNASINTLFDQSQAPPGKHTGLIWQFVPYELEGNPQKWDEVAEEYAWRCVEAWAEYAPNMTSGNVIGIYPYSPLDITRKMINMRNGGFHCAAMDGTQMLSDRPIPELGQYRVPGVERLYLCGSSQFFGGGILAMPGYNCMQVVARDLGVDDKLPIETKFWMAKRKEWDQKAEQRKKKKKNG